VDDPEGFKTADPNTPVGNPDRPLREVLRAWFFQLELPDRAHAPVPREKHPVVAEDGEQQDDNGLVDLPVVVDDVDRLPKIIAD
jgi:hypothetical protein